MPPSLPVQGAWIEITSFDGLKDVDTVSLPVQGAWIEITPHGRGKKGDESLPVQGAWIEIFPSLLFPYFSCVAPRAGSVD